MIASKRSRWLDWNLATPIRAVSAETPPTEPTQPAVNQRFVGSVGAPAREFPTEDKDALVALCDHPGISLAALRLAWSLEDRGYLLLLERETVVVRPQNRLSKRYGKHVLGRSGFEMPSAENANRHGLSLAGMAISVTAVRLSDQPAVERSYGQSVGDSRRSRPPVF